MLMSLMLVMSLWPQPEKLAIRVEEEIKFLSPGKLAESSERVVWLGQNMIRIDSKRNKKDITMIFVPGRRQMYVINHTDKNYYFVLTARDSKLLRQPLFGLAGAKDGTFEKPTIMAAPTNQRNTISGWSCREYELRYPDHFGLITTIWTTTTPTPLDRGNVRLFLHAALGTTTLPYDVKNVVNQLLRDLKGTPIRVVTTIDQEGMEVTTIRTVKKIEYKQVDPSFFELPQGYNLLTNEVVEE